MGSGISTDEWAAEIERVKQETTRPPGAITIDEFAQRSGLTHQLAQGRLNTLVKSGRAKKVIVYTRDAQGQMRHIPMFVRTAPCETKSPRRSRGTAETTKTNTKTR